MCIAYKKKKGKKGKRKTGKKKRKKKKKKDRKKKNKNKKQKKRSPYPPELSLSVGRAPMYNMYGTLISV